MAPCWSTGVSTGEREGLLQLSLYKKLHIAIGSQKSRGTHDVAVLGSTASRDTMDLV